MSISRVLPNPSGDTLNSNTAGGTRAGAYGDDYSIVLGSGSTHNFADEGSYFIARNPTDATGVATSTTATAFSSTLPYFFIYNANQTKNVILDYLKLVNTAPGTSSTNANFTSQLDFGNLYTSGSVGVTPVNVNSNVSTGAGIVMYAGTTLTTVTATSLARTLGHINLRLSIPVIGDTFMINFGGTDTMSSVSVVTTVANLGYTTSPIVIGPGSCWKANVWHAAMAAAAAYEFELGFVVR